MKNPKSKIRNPKSLHAFTLVELLVVIAIISLLVSILLPSLNMAKALARFTLCQQQLRGWGTAFELYAGEYDGFYPHIDSQDRECGPADLCGWVDVLPPLIGQKPWRQHDLYERPGKGSFLHCPAAELKSGYGYQPLRVGYFSYAMNSCLELDEDCYRIPGVEPMPSFLQTALIETPSRVILLFDQLLDPDMGYGGHGRNRSAGKHCGSYPKDFAVRHNRSGKPTGGSILYCDYSVRWTETVWKDDWPDDMNVPPRDDADWFPYQAQAQFLK